MNPEKNLFKHISFPNRIEAYMVKYIVCASLMFGLYYGLSKKDEPQYRIVTVKKPIVRLNKYVLLLNKGIGRLAITVLYGVS